MLNVGENRVKNGDLDCPEMKNEEKFLSIEQLGSSRYAKDGLKVLGDTRWNKISEILQISSRISEPYGSSTLGSAISIQGSQT
ncbi:hypothetical protein E3N88_06992 [Mikania micrantha]|uniref:Uncharacterized protein n=1 Tax=Mikania micrantha TaxID=192012 RepID=A0A5N6PRM2_9ASTR|nr:hypothetical protein E3N88_06992 [Mikania micrantha]